MFDLDCILLKWPECQKWIEDNMSSLKVDKDIKVKSLDSQGYNTNMPKSKCSLSQKHFSNRITKAIPMWLWPWSQQFHGIDEILRNKKHKKWLNDLEPCPGMVPCYVNIKLHDLVGVWHWVRIHFLYLQKFFGALSIWFKADPMREIRTKEKKFKS